MFLIIFLAAIAAGCASARPVLYPNAALQSVSPAVARQDVADCERIAKEYVSKGRAGKAAGGAVEGSAVGAAAGAAGGAVVGHAARGASVGAAAGAAGGLMRGLFRSRQPNKTYKNFVNRCLREKGYEVMGWQ